MPSPWSVFRVRPWLGQLELSHNSTVITIAVFSAIMFFGSIGLAWAIIVYLPADVLVRDGTGRNSYLARHPLFRLILFVVRNLIGLAMLAAGVIMLLTPGQGLLCIFLGILMMDFPGKSKLMRNLVRNEKVLSAINKIRGRAGKPPLVQPEANTTKPTNGD